MQRERPVPGSLLHLHTVSDISYQSCRTSRQIQYQLQEGPVVSTTMPTDKLIESFKDQLYLCSNNAIATIEIWGVHVH